MTETIFAQATPPGRSGIAVIRISGPQAQAAAASFGAGGTPLRQATLRRLTDPRDGAAIDDALVLRFAAPRSFTGEDSVEFHLHGGPAVCRLVAEALAAAPGLRPAEAGEFTRRALLNGKLDLSQAEGLGDLLAAETAEQSRRALAAMDGRVSRTAAAWREGLVRALASIEAGIDFAEEGLPDGLMRQALADLTAAAEAMEAELAGSEMAERLRLGFEVALVGPPNVGKSTLLNTLAGREAAITSEIAGTTRDPIEVRMELRGLPVTVVDLAGLRAPEGPIEAVGIEWARRRAAAADLRVFLVETMAARDAMDVDMRPGDIVAIAKADLRADAGPDAVSGRTGAGVEWLVARIAGELEGRAAQAGSLGRERQRVAVERAVAAVRQAIMLGSACADDLDLVAEETRRALHALDVLVGRVDVELVLDVVFASFCIGK